MENDYSEYLPGTPMIKTFQHINFAFQIMQKNLTFQIFLCSVVVVLKKKSYFEKRSAQKPLMISRKKNTL